MRQTATARNMNRTTKFRAWDGKEMRTSFVVHNEHGRPMITGELGGHLSVQEHWELMQFTGLTDAKGVEIYEGDIVHCEDTMRAVDRVFRTDERKEITFEDGAFRYDGITLGDMCGSGAHPLVFEVIGNIYENPELLTNGV